MLRIRGSLVAMEGMPSLTPTDTREIVYAILNNSQRQRLETDWQLDFAYCIPRRGFCMKPPGIVLLTGPTGSGNSTTLASIINEISETRDEHILTIEDPIE